MRRSLAAVHVVALALWLGALVFTFFLAKALFEEAKPVCPACFKVTEMTATDPTAGLVACATCGALHHGTCASAGCALDHEGPHVLGPPNAVAAVTTTGL